VRAPHVIFFFLLLPSSIAEQHPPPSMASSSTRAHSMELPADVLLLLLGQVLLLAMDTEVDVAQQGKMTRGGRRK
jgi:hypothetical protein